MLSRPVSVCSCCSQCHLPCGLLRCGTHAIAALEHVEKVCCCRRDGEYYLERLQNHRFATRAVLCIKQTCCFSSGESAESVCAVEMQAPLLESDQMQIDPQVQLATDADSAGPHEYVPPRMCEVLEPQSIERPSQYHDTNSFQ